MREVVAYPLSPALPLKEAVAKALSLKGEGVLRQPLKWGGAFYDSL